MDEHERYAVVLTSKRRRIRPIGRHLNHLAPESHVGQAKSPTYQAGVAKQLPNLFRKRVGCDVEILGLASEHQVPDATTDQAGFEACLGQSLQHPCSVGADAGIRDRMV